MKRYNDKMIGDQDIREFHFAGVGVHPPMTISASSQEEAEKIRKEKLGLVVVKSGYEEEPESESPNI